MGLLQLQQKQEAFHCFNIQILTQNYVTDKLL